MNRTTIIMGLAAGLSLLFSAAVLPAFAGSEAVAKAVAVLSPTEGNSAKGIVSFTKVDGGVKVDVRISGLSPGKHGFHIHELGDCSAPDGASAGGHYDPFSKPHGGPDAAERHAGDLGNVEADPSGNARYERVDSHLKLSGEGSIIGRGVIVHAVADDLASQPTGAAGARVACGVIGIAK